MSTLQTETSTSVQTFSITLPWPNSTPLVVEKIEADIQAQLQSEFKTVAAKLLRWAIVKSTALKTNEEHLFIEGAFLTGTISLQ